MSSLRFAMPIAVALVIASGVAGPGLTANAVPGSESRHSVSQQIQPRAAASWDDTLYEVGQITFTSTNLIPANPASVATDANDDTVYVANSTMGTVEVIAPGQTSGSSTNVISIASPDASDIKKRLFAIAVDSNDDTIYVANRGTGTRPKFVWAINGRTLNVDDTVTLPCNDEVHDDDAFRFITVNSTDDTVYVPCNPSDPALNTRAILVALNGRNLDDSTSIITSGSAFVGSGITTSPTDDTVYLAGWWSAVADAAVRRFTPSPLTQAVALTGGMNEPQGIAILDDTLYVSNLNTNVAMFNLRTGATAAVANTSNVGMDVARYPARNLVVVPSRSGILWVISGDGILRQTIDPTGIQGSSAVTTRSGLVYVGSSTELNRPGSRVVKVYAPTVPSPPTTIQGTAGYEQVNTSWSTPSFTGNVSWYKITASPGGASCIAQAPATTCVVGGLTAGTPYTFAVQAASSAGTWGDPSARSAPVTPLAPPSPAPAPGPGPSPSIRPGVPLDASATAGNARARITWTIPTYAGSGPVSGYRVTAAPGGETCYVDAPKTACTVHDLVNGTAYAFTVQALNEAGWGPGALTSPVTPQGPPAYSIDLDAGERVAGGINDQVRTRGTTTGIPSGARLTPYVRTSRSGEYKAGEATITVQADGSFTWTRYVRKSKPLYAYMRYEDARSNTVVWVRLATSPRMAGR